MTNATAAAHPPPLPSQAAGRLVVRRGGGYYAARVTARSAASRRGGEDRLGWVFRRRLSGVATRNGDAGRDRSSVGSEWAQEVDGG